MMTSMTDSSSYDDCWSTRYPCCAATLLPPQLPLLLVNGLLQLSDSLNCHIAQVVGGGCTVSLYVFRAVATLMAQQTCRPCLHQPHTCIWYQPEHRVQPNPLLYDRYGHCVVHHVCQHLHAAQHSTTQHNLHGMLLYSCSQRLWCYFVVM